MRPSFPLNRIADLFKLTLGAGNNSAGSEIEILFLAEREYMVILAEGHPFEWSSLSTVIES